MSTVKKKAKKITKWTKMPFPSASIDGGQTFIAFDEDQLFDWLRGNLDDVFNYKGDNVNVEFSVTMMTQKQIENLPDWEG